ncbi:hypothetical protein OEZ85_008843 [Tetradesmus obliquus]|uniref:C3H1-type domain-containing protein n=1 Tax=Tetradesmus obliquus TaxID=3088 RepID=A0ABY8TKK7_TETOB|nr:hypothetical protein OEZ85_008843 [Tetradesmus obliquus]
MDMNQQVCSVSCHGAASVIGPHADAHTSSHFFMYQYKVVLCPKRYSHDWGACPYAHEKEKARRRDPQTFQYSSCICPNASKGECPNGLQCPYAHTLFEYWLHPARFRTQMCRSGTDCRRALCFFAHTAEELRSPGKSGPCSELPPLPAAAAPGPLMGMQMQQQQQQFRSFGGAMPAVAAADMSWGTSAEDRSSSFTSSCSVVTAGGTSFLPMLPNSAPVVSSGDALYAQMPGGGYGCSSSSPLLLSSGNNILAPVQQQQMLLPGNQAYLLQLQLQQQQFQQQQQQFQQQQQLQQQAKLQVLQMELQQQQNNVRAALRGMEQQQGVSTPQGLAAAAGSSSFEGYPLTAFSSSPPSFPVAAATGQPGGSSACMLPQDGSGDFVCLQNGLINSMANMGISSGINFASGQCIVGIDNSSSQALAVS